MDDLSRGIGSVADDHAVTRSTFYDFSAADVDHNMTVAARSSLTGADDITGRSFADIRSNVDAAGVCARVISPLIGVNKLISDKAEFVKHVVDKP